MRTESIVNAENERQKQEAKVKPVSSMTALGSQITVDKQQWDALPTRCKAAWLKWAHICGQLNNRLNPVKARMALLDAVILPTLLWGLETIHLSKMERKRIVAIQRVVVHRVLRLPQRPRETLEEFVRRRERSCTTTIRKCARGDWGKIQRYRVFTFAGHVARLGPSIHLAAAVLDWGSDRWWSVYKTTLPMKTRGQPGRRAARQGRPGGQEVFFSEAPEVLRTDQDMKHQIYALHGRDSAALLSPHDWRQLAQSRESWRLFSRWACFHRHL